VVNNATHPVLNDQIVTITAAEVMTEIEGTIAKRIQASVVPQLKTAYATADWSASSAAPLFPYPARFTNDAAATFNPEAYQGRRYKNDADTTGLVSDGLLPMAAQQCNALTAGRCDTNFGTASAFVQWTLASISVAQTAGTATTFSSDCSAPTVNQIRCTISYSQVLCLLTCAINSTVRVRADARNVGKTLKTLVASAASATPNAAAVASGFALTAALQSDAAASARVTYSGTFSGGSATGICGFFISLLCSGSGVITLPITVFQDHPLVNPSSSDAWYWFTANKWYEVTYYAAAQSHLPVSATHNCQTAIPSDCLNITGGNPSSNVSSLLILAGRSLSKTARPNAALLDFLEDSANYDGDRNFAQGTLRRTYNDRFVSVANY
jgi:hypothetical protein